MIDRSDEAGLDTGRPGDYDGADEEIEMTDDIETLVEQTIQLAELRKQERQLLRETLANQRETIAINDQTITELRKIIAVQEQSIEALQSLVALIESTAQVIGEQR